MAGEGIGIGCGEGLERNRPAIRITRRMMPPIMSQGRHRSLFHQLNCFVLCSGLSWLLHICRIGSARWANGARIGCIGDHVLLEAGTPFLYPDPRETDFFKKQRVFIVCSRDDSYPSLLKKNRKNQRDFCR